MGRRLDEEDRAAAADFLFQLVLLGEFWIHGWVSSGGFCLRRCLWQGYLSTYLTLYFSVRARALASFLSAVTGTLACVLFGVFLDSNRLSIKVSSTGPDYLRLPNPTNWLLQVPHPLRLRLLSRPLHLPLDLGHYSPARLRGEPPGGHRLDLARLRPRIWRVHHAADGREHGAELPVLPDGDARRRHAGAKPVVGAPARRGELGAVRLVWNQQQVCSLLVRHCDCGDG